MIEGSQLALSRFRRPHRTAGLAQHGLLIVASGTRKRKDATS